MKTINTGNVYRIFDDSVKMNDLLPAQAYTVRFSSNTGFFLESRSMPDVNESKIYGPLEEKAAHVLTAFRKSSRSMGVILSGDKGIGKSLFSKLLSVEAVASCMPLIIVDTYIPGIASYIESIEQPVMVLFDEFDKTIGGVKEMDGQANPQTELLTLFDGISSGKKLFVITCNDLYKLNTYLVNRPGRFHYHFRFDYPSAEEIREYLEDKLPENNHKEIEAIIAFSKKISLNYDCLRAIAFEISTFNLPFKEAIKNLNIVNTEREEYNLTLVYKDGFRVRATARMNMFDDEKRTSFFYFNGNCVNLTYCPASNMYDPYLGNYVIKAEDLRYTFDEDDDFKASREAVGVDYLLITRQMASNLHYAV